MKYSFAFIVTIISLAILIAVIPIYERKDLAEDITRIATPKLCNPLEANYHIRLAEEDGSSFCSGFVISNKYAITASHCISDVIENKVFVREKSIKIFDRQGKHRAYAYVHAFDMSADIAIITGNFKKLGKAVADFKSFNIKPNADKYVTCGHPRGAVELSCTEFIPQHNIYFKYYGQGFLIGGMSGGPVININTCHVVAVNNAVGPEGVIISPLLGIQVYFKD